MIATEFANATQILQSTLEVAQSFADGSFAGRWVRGLPTPELERVRDLVAAELAARQAFLPTIAEVEPVKPPAEVAAPKIVAVEVTVNAGNVKAGAVAYGRVASLLKPHQPGSACFYGQPINGAQVHRSDQTAYSEAFPEGTLLLAGGYGGSHKNSTEGAVLLRVKLGAEGEYLAGYQKFKFTGAEQVAGAGTGWSPEPGPEVQVQEALDQFPCLAGLVAHKHWLALALAYLKAGGTVAAAK